MEVVSIVYPPTAGARPPVLTVARLLTVLPLDREQQEAYNFTVVAMDTSASPLSDSAGVSVSVVDKNDNPPLFDDDIFNFTIAEESLGNGSSPLLLRHFTVSGEHVAGLKFRSKVTSSPPPDQRLGRGRECTGQLCAGAGHCQATLQRQQ